MAFLILAGVASVLAILGRTSRLTVLRELSVPMAVTAMSAAVRALLGTFEVADGWLNGTSAVVFLALAWILVRATVMILFEWLLAQRLGVALPRLARQVVALLLYLVTATAVLKVILDIELTALVATVPADLAEAGVRFQRLAHLGQIVDLRENLMAVLVGDHVLGAGLDRGFQHGVGARLVGVVFHHTDMIEHEGHRAGLG